VNYDLLPELYNTRTTIGEYNGSIPMVGYGAGAYVLTMLDRQGLFEHSDCGSEEPVVPPDGGVPDFGDLDASTGGQEGDGGTGVLPRTGTACLCTAPGARANNAGWLLVIIAVVGTRYRRAIRRHRTRSRSCRTNTAEIPSARVDPGEFGSVGPTHPESIVIGTACEGVACP
jgi:hypothetical protein